MKNELSRSRPAGSSLAASETDDGPSVSEMTAGNTQEYLGLQSLDSVGNVFDIDEVECTDEEVMQALEKIEEDLEKAQARRTRMIELLAQQYPRILRGWRSETT